MKSLFFVSVLFLSISFFVAPDVFCQTLEYDTDRPGMDYKNFDLPSSDPNLCVNACAGDPQCKAFTYVKPGIQGPNARCWLKNSVPASRQSPCCISGIKKADAGTPAIAPVPMHPGFQVITPETGLENDSDRPGMDYKNFDLSDPRPELCRQACFQDKQCKAFSYVKPGVQGPGARCWLKAGVPTSVHSSCCISGVKASKEEATPMPLPGPKQDATPMPLPGPQSSMKPIDPKAAERQNSMKQFENNWRTSVNKVLGGLKTEVAGLQESAFQQSIQQLNLRFKQDSEADKTAGYVPEYIKQLTVTQQAVIEPKFKVDPSNLMKPPKITGVFSLGATEAVKKQNEIRSGGFVEISGENFGDCGNACGVRIEYSGQKKEFSKDAPAKYIKDLMPVGGIWAKSWGEKNIIAQVPDIADLQASATAKLVVWREGQQSFAVSQMVTLIPGMPGIHYIVTAPEYGDGKNTTAIISGGEFLIYGTDFGDKPGQVYLELTEPIKAVKKIDPPLYETITTIELTSSSTWTNNLILVKVPKISGRYVFQTAKLHVRKGNAPITSMTPVKFGPRMVAKWVPGTSFFDLDYGKGEEPSQELAKIETDGPILKVTHFPDCGTLGSGEEGNDWFFKLPKNLPEEAELLYATIQQIPPEWVNDWEDWLLIRIKDTVKACISSPYKCVWEIAKLVFYKAFDSKAGSYVVQVNDVTKQNIPLYSVHWENSCSGPYDNVPNVYTATFLVYAPEWAIIE